MNIICKEENQKKCQEAKRSAKDKWKNQEDRITRKISHDVEDCLLTKKLETQLLRERLYDGLGGGIR